jgi:hypothetical protein
VTVIRNIARFWYDFIIGDDWRLAVGVLVLVVLAAVAAHHGVNAWWLLPLGVIALLAASVAIAARRNQRA